MITISVVQIAVEQSIWSLLDCQWILVLQMQVTYISVASASHIHRCCKVKSHILVMQVQVTYICCKGKSHILAFQVQVVYIYISIASEDSSLNCIQSMASSYSLLKSLTDFAVLFTSFQAHAYVYIYVFTLV